MLDLRGLHTWGPQFREGVTPSGASALAAVTISAMNYTVIDTLGGGQRIQFTVSNSAQCVSAEVVGGSAGTAFQIDDATHVSVLAPAHASGAVSWTVTNGSGASAPFAGSKFWNPGLVTSVQAWLDAELGVTQVANAVSEWDDQTGNAYQFTQSTASRKPTWTANAFGTLHGLAFVGANAQRLGLGSVIANTGSRSIFCVAKWTSAKNTRSRNDVATTPITMVGDVNNGTIAFGATAGDVENAKLNAAAASHYTDSSGAALNDGNPHNVGATTTAVQIQLYNAGATLGSADVTAGIYASSQWDTIGISYGASATDAFDGTLAEVIVTTSAISGGDLSDIYQHARQRWGVA